MFEKLTNFVRKQRLPRSTRKVISEVRDAHLTYLSEAKLATLAELCRQHEEQQVPGVIMEAGCALGGSSIVLTEAKAADRELFVYDVFDMIPPPSENDGEDVHERYETIKSGESDGIGGDVYYGYIENLYEHVQNSFVERGYELDENNVELIKGLVEDTLHVDTPVSLAHIDVDWYDPVMTCLERIEPKLSTGGAIVLDDYGDWSGCRRAVDEYFAGKDQSNYKMELSNGAMVVTKTA